MYIKTITNSLNYCLKGNTFTIGFNIHFGFSSHLKVLTLVLHPKPFI